MAERDENLRRRLLPIFREEARERIASLSARLPELDGGDAAVMEVMFREAHSLKAAARAVGQNEIELICQTVEELFAAARRDGTTLSGAQRVALSSAVEVLEDFSTALDAAPSARQSERAVAVTKALQAALQPSPPAPREMAPAPAPKLEPPPPARTESAAAAAPETVRLSVGLLNELLLQTEEMLAEKLTVRRLATELATAAGGFSDWKKEWSPARAAMPQLRRLLAERTGADPLCREIRPALKFLEWTDRHFTTVATTVATARKSAVSEAHGLGLKVDRLLDAMKQILRLPCASLLQEFPSVVRSLARDQGKEVALVIRGADLEVDRRILQELADPLLHLLRNGVDHGIETPPERRAAGKDPRASIVLSVAARDGDKVEFAIADDGTGIAMDKLRHAAAKMGLLIPGRAAPGETELLPLIFQSGVSTSATVTDLSGRGLGLAIVREKVERLGGTVAVESAPGRGTIFRLVVPLTLAIYRGIVVRVADARFVLPTFSTERVVRVRREAVSRAESRTMVSLDGMKVPLARLRDVLELAAAPAGGRESDWLALVLLGDAAGRIAFEVDAIEGDQEILLKPLGKCLVRVRNVQGAAILPTGAIAPVLNTQDLLKSAARLTGAAVADASAGGAGAATPASILIVEDSITARGLLKIMLEAAGYHVRTAADGMEAWAMLQGEPVDLVLSDIEMPRMNGFELTARIRRDRRLARLPVVLVTALASREDFARGVDAGADAYFPKGDLEQGPLLDAIKRLL